MTKTTRAQAIASQVVDIKDTEILLLRLPPDLCTTDAAFENFAAELRTILAQGHTVENPVRIVVLRHDMELERVDPEMLAKIGLRRTDRPPGRSPELLFTAGPLRQAARAGWLSANGDRDAADVCVVTAKEEFEKEIETRRKMDVRTT